MTTVIPLGSCLIYGWLGHNSARLTLPPCSLRCCFDLQNSHDITGKLRAIVMAYNATRGKSAT